MRDTLLLVDDEPPILKALYRLLRKENFRILTADCGEQALRVLEQEPVSVILSDHSMPGMTGVQLLGEVRRHYPDTVRMILTGNADIESVTHAINEGAAYKFLLKPWDSDELVATLHEAARKYRLTRENRELLSELRTSNSELEQYNAQLALNIESRNRELKYLAHYDPLTDLPNRLLLIDRLKCATTRADDHNDCVAVVWIGIDRLKVVNDCLGQYGGDQILRAVSERLAACSGEHDSLGRVGGDEFAVLCCGIDGPEAVQQVVDRLLATFVEPFHSADEDVVLTTCCGVSIYPQDGRSPEQLLRNAAAAMHHAKEIGRGSLQYYTADVNHRYRGRLSIEASLRQAAERGEFELYYQPQVHMPSRSIVGFEALLRWIHPERGIVSPLEFLPVLEETGLILTVGDWVLREACRQARAWHLDGYDNIRMAVNLSARQFQQRNFVADVRRIIEDSAIDSSRGLVELELTESMIMTRSREGGNALRELSETGVLLAVDDFGTGYSNLGYLKHFPIQSLKIDRSFISGTPDSQDDDAIVSAIIGMAHGLGMKLVAEGVETPAQVDFLLQRGCEECQGYLFSRPVPVAEASKLLRTGLNTAVSNEDYAAHALGQ